jgi:hypothetical protein
MIKTYDNTYTGKNIYGNFILKPVNGESSFGILYKTGYIKDFISKCSEYQIQDVLKFDKIFVFNCYVKNGEIIKSLCFECEPPISSYQYDTGMKTKLLSKINPDIEKFCKKILKNCKYTGLYEFIETLDGDLFIMECNSRISSWVYNPFYYKELIEKNYKIQSDYLIKTNKFAYGKEIILFSIINEIIDFTKFKINKFIR